MKLSLLCRAVVVLQLLVALLLLLAPCANAWGCTGHMLVAEIARRRLTAPNRVKAEAIAMDFHESGPFPRSPDMVQLACWPDDVKGWHQNAMKPWHYTDIPIREGEDAPVPPVAPSDMVDVVKAIDHMRAAMKARKTPQYNINFAMTHLIHFVGDVHQPLHASSRYSKRHPDGDRGGNSVHVRVNNKMVSLHGFWDGICQSGGAPNYYRPLNSHEYSELRAEADYLMDTYKFSEELQHMLNATEMAMESHYFAINTTYDGVVEGEELSDYYLRRCKHVAESRVTLAGFRLAAMLNQLLDNIDVSTEAIDRYITKHSYKGVTQTEEEEEDQGFEAGNAEDGDDYDLREVSVSERRIYFRRDVRTQQTAGKRRGSTR